MIILPDKYINNRLIENFDSEKHWKNFSVMKDCKLRILENSKWYNPNSDKLGIFNIIDVLYEGISESMSIVEYKKQERVIVFDSFEVIT